MKGKNSSSFSKPNNTHNPLCRQNVEFLNDKHISIYVKQPQSHKVLTRLAISIVPLEATHICSHVISAISTTKMTTTLTSEYGVTIAPYHEENRNFV